MPPSVGTFQNEIEADVWIIQQRTRELREGMRKLGEEAKAPETAPGPEALR
jgi:hypothetical protein